MNEHQSDFFSRCPVTGEEYAGRHILADFWGVSNLSNVEFIKQSIEQSAKSAEADILYSYYHPFGEGLGVSGVTVLAESHISIHTWPERDFAAVDIFMCGNCDPEQALEHLINVFKPAKIEKNAYRRGITELGKCLEENKNEPRAVI